MTIKMGIYLVITFIDQTKRYQWTGKIHLLISFIQLYKKIKKQIKTLQKTLTVTGKPVLNAVI